MYLTNSTHIISSEVIEATVMYSGDMWYIVCRVIYNVSPILIYLGGDTVI